MELRAATAPGVQPQPDHDASIPHPHNSYAFSHHVQFTRKQSVHVNMVSRDGRKFWLSLIIAHPTSRCQAMRLRCNGTNSTLINSRNLRPHLRGGALPHGFCARHGCTSLINQ